MKLEITKDGSFYRISYQKKELPLLYDLNEMLKAVNSLIRIEFNITDSDLKSEGYY